MLLGAFVSITFTYLTRTLDSQFNHRCQITQNKPHIFVRLPVRSACLFVSFNLRPVNLISFYGRKASQCSLILPVSKLCQSAFAPRSTCFVSPWPAADWMQRSKYVLASFSIGIFLNKKKHGHNVPILTIFAKRD